MFRDAELGRALAGEILGELEPGSVIATYKVRWRSAAAIHPLDRQVRDR